MHPLLQARDGRAEPLAGKRLHHVVDRALLERRDRVFVVGGHEDDVTLAARASGDFEPAHAGHLDVEEQHVGHLIGERRDGGGAILRFRTNRELGPQLAEQLLELAAQQRLVFSDDRRRRVHGAISA